MSLNYMETLPSTGGFNYDNCIRNKALMNNMGMGLKSYDVKEMKTGTTICGLVFKVSAQLIIIISQLCLLFLLQILPLCFSSM